VLDKRLSGQIAWISGGASGMGEAVAELFAVEGARVVVADIQQERGHLLVARISASGGAAHFSDCDVTQETQVRASIEDASARFGGVNILVNCAGVVHVGALHEYSEADWDLLMGVNLKSIFFSLKHALPHLKRGKRSYVVNIGSVGSLITQGLTPAYIASKHAVLGLSRSIAVDYAADGLRCNCICPGITDTPMLRYHLSTSGDPAANLAARLRRVPMGVSMFPRDIARAVLFLSCEDSSGITGTSLVVDGGYIATAEWETAAPTQFMKYPL